MKSLLPEFNTIEITLDKIRGLDPEIQKFLDTLAYVPDLGIDLAAWSPTSARLIYCRLPMFVVRRKSRDVQQPDKFDVIGDGRTLLLAQKIFAPDIPFPVNCLTAKRLDTEIKLTLLATEIYGLTPLYRTRRNLPKRSMSIWESLKASGVATIQGDGPKAFSRGSGYSLASLTKQPKKKSAQQAVES